MRWGAVLDCPQTILGSDRIGVVPAGCWWRGASCSFLLCRAAGTPSDGRRRGMGRQRTAWLRTSGSADHDEKRDHDSDDEHRGSFLRPGPEPTLPPFPCAGRAYISRTKLAKDF